MANPIPLFAPVTTPIRLTDIFGARFNVDSFGEQRNLIEKTELDAVAVYTIVDDVTLRAGHVPTSHLDQDRTYHLLNGQRQSLIH